MTGHGGSVTDFNTTMVIHDLDDLGVLSFSETNDITFIYECFVKVDLFKPPDNLEFSHCHQLQMPIHGRVPSHFGLNPSTPRNADLIPFLLWITYEFSLN